MTALGLHMAMVAASVPTSSTSQVDQFINLLASPAGWAAIVVLGLAAAAAMRFKAARWGAIALAMYFSTLAAPVQFQGNTRPLIFPSLISVSRPLTIAFIGIALVPAIFSGRGWRGRIVLASGMAFFLLEIAFSVRTLYAGNLPRGLAGGVLFVMVFLTFAVGTSRWMQEMPDVLGALRAITICSLIFVLLTFAALVVRPAAVMTQGRLMALTGNPQHLALVIGASLPALMYLAVRNGEPKGWRILTVVVLAILVMFLLWSGSRTGALMAFTAVGLQFRRRLGRLAILVVVVSLLTMLAMTMFPQSQLMLDRLFSTQNTREVWANAWALFLQHPLLGYMSPHTDSVLVENSYLSAAGMMGLVGVALMAVLVFTMLRTMWQMSRARQSLGEESMLADMVLAGIGSALVGAIFEAFLLGTLTNQVFNLYLYLAVGAFILDVQALNSQPVAYEAERSEHEEYVYG